MDILRLIHVGSQYSESRPFRCDWEGCTKAFSRRFDLARHGRIHTNESEWILKDKNGKPPSPDDYKKYMEFLQKLDRKLLFPCPRSADDLELPMKTSEAAPRKMNSFLTFRRQLVYIFKQRKLSDDGKVLSRAASYIWNGASQSEKQSYVQIAEELNRRHLLRYPNYTYERCKRKTAEKDFIIFTESFKETKKNDYKISLYRKLLFPCPRSPDDYENFRGNRKVNGFVLFRRQLAYALKNQELSDNGKIFSRTASYIWRGVSESERQSYVQMAEELNRRYSDYAYERRKRIADIIFVNNDSLEEIKKKIQTLQTRAESSYTFI